MLNVIVNRRVEILMSKFPFTLQNKVFNHKIKRIAFEEHNIVHTHRGNFAISPLDDATNNIDTSALNN